MSDYEDLLRALTAERFRAPAPSSPAEHRGSEPARADRADDQVTFVDSGHAAVGGPGPRSRLEARGATVEKLLLRVEEVAGLLDVGRSQVYAPIKAGDLASVKIGGSRRITRDQLHECLERLVTLGAERLPATAPPAVQDRAEGEALDKPLQPPSRHCRRRSDRGGPIPTRSLP
jgi:excisionase family DNA binding protein